MLLFKRWHLFLQIAIPRKKTGHFSCKYFVRFISLSRIFPSVPRIVYRSTLTKKSLPRISCFDWLGNSSSLIWATGKLWIESHMSQIPYFTVHLWTPRVVVGNPNTVVKNSSVNLKSRTNVGFHNVLINKWNLWNEF